MREKQEGIFVGKKNGELAVAGFLEIPLNHSKVFDCNHIEQIGMTLLSESLGDL